MLFLFPVKDGKFSTGVNATFDASSYTVSLQQSKITLQNNRINNTSITQPTLSFYLQLSRKLLWLELYCSTPEVHQISSKAGSGINILYLLTGPITQRTMIPFCSNHYGAI